MPDYTYTLILPDGRRRVIRSPRKLSEVELQQLAQQLRAGVVTEGRGSASRGSAAPQVIPPSFTERAKQLANLLASMREFREADYAKQLRLARQYAPAGTGEGEIRAALIEAERARGEREGSFWRQLWNLMVRPESAAPDKSSDRQVGVLEAIGNVLRTPQRALVAGALTTLARGRTIGKESGEPTQVQDFASAYAADPTYGSLFEAVMPSVPSAVRRGAGVLADIFVDPLNLLAGLGVIGRGAQASKPIRVVREVAEKAAEQSGSKVARALTREIPALSALDRPASANLSALLGIDPKKAAESSSPLRFVGLLMHSLLDPNVALTAIREARGAERGTRLAQVFEDIAAAHELRRRVAGGEQAGQAFRAVREQVGRTSGALGKELSRLNQLEEAGKNPSTYQRVLSFWKATKTTMNPPSFVRNFFQNFVLRFLEGEPIGRVPAAVVELIRDSDRFKQLWAQTDNAREALEEAQQQPSLLRRFMEASARAYEGADRLAAVLLSQATSKPPSAFLMNYGEIPESFEWLRRSGVAPFVAWQYFAIPAVVRGAIDHPARLRAVLQGISALQPDSEKRGEFLRVGDREMRVGTVLPLNPADFGGEMPLIDIRQMPLYNLLSGLESTLTGKGRPWPMQDASTSNRILDAGLFLKDFFAPPALGYYVPGLVSPPKAELGKRMPRERIDYVLGLLGLPTRPVDKQYEAVRRFERLQREANRMGASGRN
jgi:hypothetical protein